MSQRVRATPRASAGSSKNQLEDSLGVIIGIKLNSDLSLLIPAERNGDVGLEVPPQLVLNLLRVCIAI